MGAWDRLEGCLHRQQCGRGLGKRRPFTGGALAPEPPPEPDPPDDPDVIWIGTPNFTPGRPAPAIALVVHTATGTLAGTDGWFNNQNNTDASGRPGTGSSAHYCAADDGRAHQYVDLWDTAHANGVLESGNRWADVCRLAGHPEFSARNPNGVTVSIETEDFNDPNWPVSDAQFETVVGLGRITIRQYPSIRVLTGHRVISPLSRDCPWPRWYATGALGRLAGILGLELVL